MGRIQVLPEHVANKIAAGEVVERPASAVKELVENALDAGARRIRVQIEGGGKRLIQVVDDGCGMVRDDAMLAFERHATSKLKNADDLLHISTLGFRGEALPSMAAVSRLRLETRSCDESSGTAIEIAGGKFLRVEEAGLPPGTSITIRDLFFNTPARKKFLKAESTELSHIASLVTHYALAHPDKHFELHSASNAMLVAAPVASHADRIYQIFGKGTLNELLPLAALRPLERRGLPDPPPWVKTRLAAERARYGEDEPSAEPEVPGELRLHGFVSKPEVQKLNRNSIFVFVNRRLIRDRLIQHALTEAYRNVIPPTVYPVVLLFLEMPYGEVDANVHPAKTEVRFRQQSLVHDFVRDAVRAALMKARPVPQFTTEITAQPKAAPALSPGAQWVQQRGPQDARFSHAGVDHPNEPPPGSLGTPKAAAGDLGITSADADFALRAPSEPPRSQTLSFPGTPLEVGANAALPAAHLGAQTFAGVPGRLSPPLLAPSAPKANCGGEIPEVLEKDAPEPDGSQPQAPPLGLLRPVGQIRNSFILAVNEEGLWIIDQHGAHERVLFEKVLRQRTARQLESQRMLMPMIVELTPAQQAVFSEINDELARNGFEIEPFGSRTVAVKTAPAGIEACDVERMLHELLEQFAREEQAINLETVGAEIAASIACHAAIKVNTLLEADKMEWLLRELARTECPMSCPHGRPVVLRYSVKEIQRAFKRI